MYARRGGDGKYKKIPVIVVNGEFEVRDSTAITKALAPMVQGRPLTGTSRLGHTFFFFLSTDVPAVRDDALLLGHLGRARDGH